MIFTTGTGPSKDKLAQEQIAPPGRCSAQRARRLEDSGNTCWWRKARVEAALDWTSKPWDLAPLGIIVEEAGGRSTNVRASGRFTLGIS